MYVEKLDSYFGVSSKQLSFVFFSITVLMVLILLWVYLGRPRSFKVLKTKRCKCNWVAFCVILVVFATIFFCTFSSWKSIEVSNGICESSLRAQIEDMTAVQLPDDEDMNPLCSKLSNYDLALFTQNNNNKATNEVVGSYSYTFMNVYDTDSNSLCDLVVHFRKDPFSSARFELTFDKKK